jgi:hypothetical protein
MTAASLSTCNGEAAPSIRRANLHRFVCQCEDQAVLAVTEDYGSARFIDSRLSDLFDALNVEYFEGRLPTLPVRVGIPWLDEDDEWQGTNGQTRLIPHDGDGRRGADFRIYLADFLFSFPFEDEVRRWHLVADTLLHEMIHPAVYLDLPYFSKSIRIAVPLNESEAEREDCAEADWPETSSFTPRYEPVLSSSVIENFAYPSGRP